LKFTLGVKDVFDKDPPYTNVGGQAQFQTGYDATYADPRGRFNYGSLTYSFLKVARGLGPRKRFRGPFSSTRGLQVARSLR